MTFEKLPRVCWEFWIKGQKPSWNLHIKDFLCIKQITKVAKMASPVLPPLSAAQMASSCPQVAKASFPPGHWQGHVWP